MNCLLTFANPLFSPPPNTRPSPSPALDRPDSLPATLPIGPGKADSTPLSSLNLSFPASPPFFASSANLSAASVAFA